MKLERWFVCDREFPSWEDAGFEASVESARSDRPVEVLRERDGRRQVYCTIKAGGPYWAWLSDHLQANSFPA